MLYEVRHLFKRRDWKGFKNCLKVMIPPRIECNIIFRKNWHQWINFKEPTLFDEKLLILKSGEYFHNPFISACTDKFKVRKYIQSKGLSKQLVELYGAYDSVDEIPFEELPDRFVIKCNHGCGMNVIVSDRKNMDIAEIKSKVDDWMHINYGLISGERHYCYIKPKIVVEEYIGGEDGTLPIDYKFYASRGKVICCLVITGRGGKQKWVFVDADFADVHLIDGAEEYVGDAYEDLKPKGYDAMVKTAERLSEDFPFVRVDLYERNGDVLFGELTYTPHGCCHTYMSREAQEWIGKQIVL